MKARQIQTELLALATGREAEQAVIAVFLHSQPTGHKAQTPELRRLAESTAPDAIELDKGLRRWRDVFLVPRRRRGRDGGRERRAGAAEVVAARQPAQPAADAR